MGGQFDLLTRTIIFGKKKGLLHTVTDVNEKHIKKVVN